jgi:glucokinase
VNDRHLGLDLGGTSIKVAVLEQTDTGFETELTGQRDTQAWLGPEAVTGNLIAAAREAIASSGPVSSVGLGVPGLFEASTGHVILLPNLPGEWKGFPLREKMQKAIGAEVSMVNDARAFTLAEGTMGAGAGHRIVVCMTLGTGVGGGIMIDGRLHLGAFGVAGELGHQTVDPDGRHCGCGNRGCVEAMARADVLAAMAGKGTAEEAYASAAAGDAESLAAIREVARYLGIGLANVVTVLGPDRIVIGGGIVEAGDLVLGPIREAVRERVTLVPTDLIEVVPASLGTKAGALGAALAGLFRP